MNDAGGLAYEAAYRRVALVLVVVLLALAGGAAALAGVLMFVSDTDTILFAVLGIAGGTIMASVGALLTALRVHRWDVAADGLRIEERPQIPLAGRRMRAVVPFADILALRRVESGTEVLLELAARNGAVHRMAQAMRADEQGRLSVPDVAGLEAFASAGRDRRGAAGFTAPVVTEGLSFWNRAPGLALLGAMFVVSLLIAGAAGFAMWEGAELHGAQLKGAAFILALPVGAGYLILRAVRRRGRVLRG